MAQFKHIKGGEALQKFLTELPVKIEQNIMRSALRAGAKVIADEAKRNVPIQSGDLRNSIRLSTKSRRGRVSATVKAGNKKAWYYRFVEFGTAAHEIKPKNAKSLFVAGIFSELVNHPGARAKPFMRPAFDSRSNDAIRAVGLKIKERLNKQGINQADGLEVGDEYEQ